MEEVAGFFLIASVLPLVLGGDAFSVMSQSRKLQENRRSRRKVLDGMLLLIATDLSCASWILIFRFSELVLAASNHGSHS
jgi:hypothetical protein